MESRGLKYLGYRVEQATSWIELSPLSNLSKARHPQGNLDIFAMKIQAQYFCL